MAVRVRYSIRQVDVTPNHLYQYDKRDKKGVVNTLLNAAVNETRVSPRGELAFRSQEITRAVYLYAEQFCLSVEDTLTAFWSARAGNIGLGLPIWLQNSNNKYNIPAVEAGMGEAVAGYLMERIYGASLNYRPRGKSPDMYMIFPDGYGATIEAKASITLEDSSLEGKLAEALSGLLTIWSYIDSVQNLRELAGFCIAVSIGESLIRASLLRMEYRP